MEKSKTALFAFRAEKPHGRVFQQTANLTRCWVYMFDPVLYNEAVKKVPKKYLLANLVSMRMRQIINGSDPLVEVEDMSPMDIALKEIAEGVIEPRKLEEVLGEEIFG